MKALSYFFDCANLCSGRACTIQVIKACNGFSQNNINVKLYAPILKGFNIQNVRSIYNVKPGVKIKKIPFMPFFKFFLNTIIMFFYFMKDSNKYIYTRNIYFAFIISFSRRTIIYEAHQYLFRQKYHTILQLKILKLLAQRKNFFLIAISNALKKKFEKSGIYIPMLVCHDGYEENDIKSEKGIQINKIPYDAIAMYIGSLKKFKGLSHIEFLASKNNNVKFYIIGDNNRFCDRDILKRLERLKNVYFVGYVSHSKIYKYLEKSDILLLLPTKEGFYNDVSSPLKLFEYMNAGKAILATDMPSIREVLIDGYNALIAPDNEEIINQKFKILVQDKNLCEKIGINAKKEVIKYSWKKRAKKIKDYLGSAEVD